MGPLVQVAEVNETNEIDSFLDNQESSGHLFMGNNSSKKKSSKKNSNQNSISHDKGSSKSD